MFAHQCEHAYNCMLWNSGVWLTLAVAWHCGFALRVFMRVLSHGWTEGLTAHHRWRRQLLFFNATQNWRTLLLFLKQTKQQTSIRPKAIQYIIEIHVDTGKNSCQSIEMKMVLTFFAWGGDWWTKAYWEIWGECIMSGEGLSRICAVEIKTQLKYKYLQCCPIQTKSSLNCGTSVMKFQGSAKTAATRYSI